MDAMLRTLKELCIFNKASTGNIYLEFEEPDVTRCQRMPSSKLLSWLTRLLAPSWREGGSSEGESDEGDRRDGNSGEGDGGEDGRQDGTTKAPRCGGVLASIVFFLYNCCIWLEL